MPTSKPPYTAAFRQQMVELAMAGRGLKQLSREFGVSANSLRNWVVQARGEGVGSQTNAVGSQTPLSKSEREELQELRRKLRQVQQERDILAKATAWFAGKSERTSTTSSNS
jgi:transposase